MSDGLEVTRDVTIPLGEVTVRTSRSSGPGGQHANVTVFDVTASRALSEEQRARLMARCGPRITAVAQEARSQARNRELALERLRQRIARGLHVHRPRRATKPGRGARERRLETKRRRGQTKRGRRRPDPSD